MSNDIEIQNPEPIVVVLPPPNPRAQVHVDPPKKIVTQVAANPPSVVEIVPGGGGSGASSMSQLTDVDLSGGIADGVGLHHNLLDELWRPAMSEDLRRYRGEWQAPAETLLWSSDFSDPADLTLFSSPAVSGGLTASLKQTSTSSITPSGTATPWCFELRASDFSSTGVGAASTNLDLSDMPDLAGHPIFKIAVEFAAVSTTNTNHREQFKASGSTMRIIMTNPSTLSNWAVSDILMGGAIDPLLSFHIEDTGGSNGGASVGLFMTNLRIYGSSDSEDLYMMGDVVSRNGDYWRSLYDNNVDDPADFGPKWLQIPNPHRTLSARLENLLDVNPLGRVDGSYLRWDAASSSYVHDMAPDRQHFRGDWQDPANSLLWSADFTDPADLSFFTNTDAATTFARNNPPSAWDTLPPFAYVLRIQHAAAPQMLRANFNLGAMGLSGRYVSQVKAWIAGRNSTTGATPNSIGLLINDVTRTGAVPYGNSTPNWSETTYNVSASPSALALYVENGNTAHTRQMEFAGLRIYGTLDNADLYQTNDVVVHAGVFYRSLYNNNAETPGSSPKWLVIPGI